MSEQNAVHLTSSDILYEIYNKDVNLSYFFTMVPLLYHHMITITKSDVYAKYQGQGSRSQMSKQS